MWTFMSVLMYWALIRIHLIFQTHKYWYIFIVLNSVFIWLWEKIESVFIMEKYLLSLWVSQFSSLLYEWTSQLTQKSTNYILRMLKCFKVWIIYPDFSLSPQQRDFYKAKFLEKSINHGFRGLHQQFGKDKNFYKDKVCKSSAIKVTTDLVTICWESFFWGDSMSLQISLKLQGLDQNKNHSCVLS